MGEQREVFGVPISESADEQFKADMAAINEAERTDPFARRLDRMEQLVDTFTAELVGVKAERDALQAQLAEAAVLLKQLSGATPFRSYESWRADGNEQAALVLEGWDRLRQAAQELVASYEANQGEQ